MKKPAFLKPGDMAGIVAPAGYIEPEYIIKAKTLLEGWGLEVILSENIFSRFHIFAGNDPLRKTEVQKMLDHPAVKVIFFARGGYGTSRIIDGLSFNQFISNPKWMVGFSDITTLLLKSYSLGVECIHGPMPLNLGGSPSPDSINNLKNLLFGSGEFTYQFVSHPENKPGSCTGQIMGGNLSILTANLGTDTDFDTTGKVLFIEEVEEYLYRTDRMLIQLKRAGKLSNLSGLIAGYFTRMLDNEIPFGNSVTEIILEHTREFNYPVCFGIPVGHQEPNFSIPVGRDIQLTVNLEKVIITDKK